MWIKKVARLQKAFGPIVYLKKVDGKKTGWLISL
jgi:hypothetical protein